MENFMTRKPESVTRKEYNDFHAVDRKLYATLVYDLCRNPIKAMQMMAVWLWFERVGTCNMLTRRILLFPVQVINKMGDEALLFWAFISNPNLLFSDSPLEIPLTRVLLQNEISVLYLRRNQGEIIAGINEVREHICTNCFEDIMDDVNERNGRLAFFQSMAHLQNEMVTHERAVPAQRAQAVPPQRARVRPVHPDDRTLFLTFSKGYPVAEWEVRDFFTTHFGDCIEAFFMQEVSDGEQPLFARVVFYKPSFIQVILGDDDAKAKFTINKRHVWMRKFIPRRPRGTSIRRRRRSP